MIKVREQSMDQQIVDYFCDETLQSTKDLKKKIIKLQDYEQSYKQYRNQINYAFTYPNQYSKSQIEYLINYSELELNKFAKVINTLSVVDQRPYLQDVTHYQQYLKEHRELITLFQNEQKFIEKVKQSTQINQHLFAQYLESLSIKHFFRGMMLLTGSFIIHLIIGASSRWNMLNPYITSFYKITNQPYLFVTEDSFASPLSLFCMGLGMRVGLRVNQTLGTLNTIIFSLFSAAGVVYVSSLMQTFVQYVIFSFAIFPFLICFSFQLIISECTKYYPKYQLLIYGFILTSNALGHVIFGLINIQCFNPEDFQAKNGFFGNELDFIARQVPKCTKETCYLILLLGTIAIAFIYPALKFNQNKKKDSRKNSNRVDFEHICASQKQALKSHIFWIMVAMILCTTSANYFLITNYKNLASKYHKNTINLAGVLLGFNLANALSRAFWDVFFTKIGFKWCMVILTTLNALNLGTISLIVNQFNIYRLYYIIGGATLGGCMVCFLNFTNLVFGQYVGQQLPGYIWTSYSLANLLQYAVFNSYDLSNLGYVPSCIFLSMLSVISLLIVVSTKMQGNWQNKLHLLEAKCCFN